ncbi:MAG: TorF family putative porin [Pseudomonadota bacterium]
MKNMTKSLIAAAVLAATSTAVMAEVSMNVGATSNYLFRGISASADNAAVSGGIDYSHEVGVYAGMWVSTLDTDLGEELDYYVGYAGEAGGFGYDASLIGITYPQLEDSNYVELALSGSYSYFTAGLAATVASDVKDEKATAEQFIEEDLYYYVSAELPLNEEITLGLTAGNYTFADDGVDDAEFDYTHFQLAVSKGDVTVAYDATDIDDDPTTDYKEDAGHFTVSWSKSF